MPRITLLLVLVLTPLFTQGQSSYDSLKQIYSAQHVFEQREKGSTDSYIKKILAATKNPEIRQLTACAIAENLYGSGNWVNNKNLLKLVEDVINNPETENTHAVAVKVKAEIERSLVGSKILPIALPDSKEDTLYLTDYYSANHDYVVIDLWATWCGPCISEMKKFSGMMQQYNIEFYSISIDDNISNVQKFANRNPTYTWPIVFAGKESALMDYFKVRLIPAFVIVDRNGIIVSHIVGKGLEDELKKLYIK